MTEHSFTARLERPGGKGAWTLVRVPFDVEDAFGTRGRVPVKATVNGSAYASSLMPDGEGGHFLVVNAAVRNAAGVDAGDDAVVTVTKDAKARVVRAPKDLADALKGAPDADAAWKALAPSHKREYVSWITEAKRAETRTRRVEKALQMLADGKRLK